MKTIKNSTGSKSVNINQNNNTFFAMYFQIYNNEQQVLESKSFANIKNAEKWAKKKLN